MTRSRPQSPDSNENVGLSGLVLLWNEPIFGPDRPLRLFIQRVGAHLSPALLWADHWYSGLVTRTLSPFWRGNRTKLPPSFLFVPGHGPFPDGFVVLPYREGELDDLAKRLYDTVAGLSVNPVVVDNQSILPGINPVIQKISQKLIDRNDVRLYVSDPSVNPGTFGCMTFAGVSA